MFNALLLSYSYLPLALALEGFLPALFARRSPKTGAPTAAVLGLCVLWAGALTLGFDRLVLFDITFYGLSLILEFGALIALRRREPNLTRPFRIPGGLPALVGLSLPPLCFIAMAFLRNRGEQLFGISALWLALGLIALGAPIYYLARLQRWQKMPLPTLPASMAEGYAEGYDR